MKILYRPITDGRNPVVDFGDSWGRIDKKGEPLFSISKKEEPNWLIAFVSKWMQEELTEFGGYYCDALFAEDEKKSGSINDAIKSDRSKIDGKFKKIIKGEFKGKITKVENSAILKKIFSKSIIVEAGSHLGRSFEEKILFPPFEFKDDTLKFMKFTVWLGLVESKDKEALACDSSNEEFLNILRNNEGKYIAYGIKRISGKITFIEEYRTKKQ